LLNHVAPILVRDGKANKLRSLAENPSVTRCLGRTVAKLIYTAIMSLDGYIADKNSKFDWG